MWVWLPVRGHVRPHLPISILDGEVERRIRIDGPGDVSEATENKPSVQIL